MPPITGLESDAVFGHFGFEAQNHLTLNVSYAVCIPKATNRIAVEYARRHVAGSEFMTDAQVLAHLASLAFMGFMDGLETNPSWRD